MTAPGVSDDAAAHGPLTQICPRILDSEHTLQIKTAIL